MGYSEKNKEIYCGDCIIYRKTGNCEYLKYLESTVSVDLGADYVQESCIDECGF
jgi:hypothetical protein